MEKKDTSSNIEVLREMVRLAENRRAEALEMIEKLNKYNLAIIAFSGTFLAVLVASNLANFVVRIAGLCVIISILTALYAIRPQKVSGGTLDIADDVKAIKNGTHLTLNGYLLDIAHLTNYAAEELHKVARSKKRITLFAALFLAFSLIIAYILITYA